MTSSRLTTAPEPLQQYRLRVFASVAFTAVLTLIIAGGTPSLAQDDPQSDELEEIEREQEQNEAAQADTERRIDGTSAEIDDLALAIETMDRAINEQTVAVANTQTNLRRAETVYAESTAAVSAAEAALIGLEEQVRRRAVASFIGQDTTTPDIVYTDSPGLTVRMETLLNSILQGDADVAEAFVAVQHELAVERETARTSRVAANEFRIEAETLQRRLQGDREIQEALLVASTERYEHLLYEQESLKAIGLELKAEEKQELDKIRAAQLAARYTGPGGSAGPVATPDEIRWVGGIAIHESIAPQLQALLDAAKADGITLAGGGWRDPSEQIRLRRAHCGTSDYAIWEAPAGSCRPPTARPGSSLHERGLAVDFSDNGRSINSPNSRAFLWLKANAAKYGFYNLPSERWHWSTTGR